jgi:hypothetical protein
MANNNDTTIMTFENQSEFMILLLIIFLFVPSIGCTIFLLFHFGRLRIPH